MKPKLEVLLNTISSLKIKYPVPKAQLNYAISILATKSKKVEIYRNDEPNPYKVYHVGGTTADSKGTYMIMEVGGKVAQRPYVMTVPSFEGVLDIRYFTDEMEWRSTEIFDLPLDKIRSVSLNYANYPEHSFTITANSSDSFSVTPINDSIAITSPIYKEGVVKYLSSFEFLHAEAFRNSYVRKDSIINSGPYLTILVTDKDNRKREMIIFPMPLNKRSKTQFDRLGNQLKYDMDHYYALINDRQDFVSIQHFVFGKVFKKYSDFFLRPKGS